MNIFTGLFLVLWVLKLLGVIAVSWWVVASPIIALLVLRTIMLLVLGAIYLFNNYLENK